MAWDTHRPGLDADRRQIAELYVRTGNKSKKPRFFACIWLTGSRNSPKMRYSDGWFLPVWPPWPFSFTIPLALSPGQARPQVSRYGERQQPLVPLGEPWYSIRYRQHPATRFYCAVRRMVIQTGCLISGFRTRCLKRGRAQHAGQTATPLAH